MIRIRGLGFVGIVASLVGWSTVASAGPAPKVDLCHWEGTTGRFHIINISSNAVSAHLRNHGDSAPARYWTDGDGDGFGDATAAGYDVCPQPGLVDNADDCDDGDADVNPGAVEQLYNGVDDDCDAATPDDDLDNDGYGHGEDCDEGRADVNPGMNETPYNGFDDDCNPATPDDDLDADGHGLETDCDDLDAATHPGAADLCGDGLDNDCDGIADEDCQAVCPCFGAADIEAAYAEYLAKQGEATVSDALCYDASYVGAYELTTLYFRSQTFNYPLYEYDLTKFYTYGYDELYGKSYCESYENAFVYDYETGEMTPSTSDFFRYIDGDQRDACSLVILDWAADADLSCTFSS